MTALGNNQYTLILEVIPGVHYYSFTINNGTQLESLSDDVCTVGSLIGGYLRELVVSEDVNVAMVCWESCAPCAVGVEVLNTDKVHVFPNPANETVRLELQQPWQATYRLLDEERLQPDKPKAEPVSIFRHNLLAKVSINCN